MDRARLPPQRRLHPRPGDAVPGHASRTGAPPRPRADRAWPGSGGDRAPRPGDRPRVPDLLPGSIPRARSRAHPPPPHGVSRRAHAAPALARLCDRAHGSALACHGAREGRSVRGARDRTRIAARQGVPGSRRHDPALLPAQLPIALDSGRAVFVYVDPGHDTSTALRSWGAAHRGLWHALQGQGRSVEVVAVARTSRELEKQVRRQPGPGSIRRASTWRTVRLAGARYR